MKIRNGFVSNSSSSSFIIAIENGVNTLGKLQDYLFGEATSYDNPYCCSSHDVQSWPVSDISAIVYQDINKSLVSAGEMIDANMCGYTPEYDQAEKLACQELGVSNLRDYYKDSFNENYQTAHKTADKYRLRLCEDKINKFIDDNPDHNFYIVEYSDSDGSLFSAMEHGDLFDNIPHIRISYH